GAARAGQWMAALFAATLPMAILQASSTQNDLVVAFLCLAFLHGALASARSERVSWPLLLCCGAAMGLAIHAKGTAYFFLAAAGLAWGVALLVRHRVRALAPLSVAALLVALPNAPHAARNMAVLGTPLVPA